MAGRLPVDDAVVERRLRPIYDWLDNGNNKKAAQEADKVLKKQPKLQCANVLKGLALLRLGRRDECKKIISSVVAEGTTDEPTLQALTICYRELHQPEQICHMYETAVKVEPTNEELLSHLFMSHVRIGDYKRQEHAAMQLYKLKPKNPYYFWAVVSIVMQAQKNSGPKGKLSLQVAERMVMKFVIEGKIEAEAEVLMYLHILEMQEKYSEALGVLEGPLVAKITQQPRSFVSIKKAFYNFKLGNWETANNLYKKLISQEPDNWQHYVQFAITLKMVLLSPSQSSTDLFVSGVQFLRGLMEKAVKEKSRYRSQYFGVLQLALIFRENGLDNRLGDLNDQVVDILFSYLEAYGDKMCCYGDVINFLPIIPQDAVPELLERLHALITFDDNGIPIDISSVHRHQTWLQLQIAFGQELCSSPIEHIKSADHLVSVYHHTAHLSASMAATDIRPNDTYLILATHSYLEAMKLLSNCDNNAISPCHLLIKAVAILEHGVNVSKANFQMKLLLIRIYNMIGATGASAVAYEKLDLKHIQLDTLGNLLVLQAVDSANYSLASELFSSTLKFFMTNYKDTSDPLLLSYKFGSLTKIPEFVEFRERLNSSFHFFMVSAEQMQQDMLLEIFSLNKQLDVVKQLDVNPATDVTDFSTLRDNRDLLVMDCWQSDYKCVQEKLKKETFEDSLVMLRIRCLLLKLVSAIVSAASPCKNGNDGHSFKENGAIINSTRHNSPEETQLLELIEKLEKESCEKYLCKTQSQSRIQGPDPSRIYVYTQGGYVHCLLKVTQVFVHVLRCTRGTEDLDSWSGDVIKEAVEATESLLISHLQHLDAFSTSATTATPVLNTQCLAHLSHLAQTVGLVVIILGGCHMLLKPLRSTVGKGNRKKKTSPLPEAVVQFNSCVATTTAHVQKFEGAINSKLNATKSPHGESGESPSWCNQMTSPLPNLDYGKVCNLIEESFVNSLQNLSKFLGHKAKFASSLKI